MKILSISLYLIFCSLTLFAQKITVTSPNQKISVSLYSKQNADVGEWYLKINYLKEGKSNETIPQISLGLSRSDQDFVKDLKFLKAGKQVLINDNYILLHGINFISFTNLL